VDASKPVVIWDVDDVLNDLMREWFEGWWVPAHPRCAAEYGRLASNPPHDVLGISEQEYLSSLDAFRSDRFAALVPRPGALRWFGAHGDRADHIALTAVPAAFAHLSAAWVVEHFGRWIRTFAFVPSRRGGAGVAQHPQSKADYLRWLGRGDIFVDDRPANVEAARALGLTGIVVPSPWSESPFRSLDAALDHLTQLISPHEKSL